jgi:hypothetical protein
MKNEKKKDIRAKKITIFTSVEARTTCHTIVCFWCSSDEITGFERFGAEREFYAFEEDPFTNRKFASVGSPPLVAAASSMVSVRWR